MLVFGDVGHTAMMEVPVDSARAMIGLLDDAAAVTPGGTEHTGTDVRS